MKSPFLIIAHRGGGRGEFQENTLEAFQNAVFKGFKAIEMDVRMDTKRERFFLEHDFLYSPTVKSNVFEKVIPIFEKDVLVFTELKTMTFKRRDYAELFCEFIRRHHLQDQVVVISFNPFILKMIREIEPKLKLGFLCGTALTYMIGKKYFFESIKPDFFIISKRIIDEKKVKFAHDQGAKVLSTLTNKEKHILKAGKLGVDGIITDFPELAANLLHSQATFPIHHAGHQEEVPKFISI